MSGEFRPLIFAMISRKIPSILYIDTSVGPLPSQCLLSVQVSRVLRFLKFPPADQNCSGLEFCQFQEIMFQDLLRGRGSGENILIPESN